MARVGVELYLPDGGLSQQTEHTPVTRGARCSQDAMYHGDGNQSVLAQSINYTCDWARGFEELRFDMCPQSCQNLRTEAQRPQSCQNLGTTDQECIACASGRNPADSTACTGQLWQVVLRPEVDAV